MWFLKLEIDDNYEKYHDQTKKKDFYHVNKVNVMVENLPCAFLQFRVTYSFLQFLRDPIPLFSTPLYIILFAKPCRWPVLHFRDQVFTSIQKPLFIGLFFFTIIGQKSDLRLPC